jgi:hypothetical protein
VFHSTHLARMPSMSPEELLSYISEPIEGWISVRHSFTDGLLVFTSTRLVFIAPNTFGGSTKETSWSLQDIENITVAASFSRFQINIKTQKSIVEERFETENDQAESFVSTVQQQLNNPDKRKSEVIPEAKQKKGISIPSKKTIPNKDSLVPQKNEEPNQTTVGLEKSSTIKHQEPITTEYSEPDNIIETTSDKEPEDKELSPLEETILELNKEMTDSWPWQTKLGCLVWIALGIGPFFVTGTYFSVATGGGIACCGLSLGVFIFGIAAVAGDKNIYHKKIRPKIENILINENLDFDQFAQIAIKVLPEGTGLSNRIKDEAGIEDEVDTEEPSNEQ